MTEMIAIAKTALNPFGCWKCAALLPSRTSYICDACGALRVSIADSEMAIESETFDPLELLERAIVVLDYVGADRVLVADYVNRQIYNYFNIFKRHFSDPPYVCQVCAGLGCADCEDGRSEEYNVRACGVCRGSIQHKRADSFLCSDRCKMVRRRTNQLPKANQKIYIPDSGYGTMPDIVTAGLEPDSWITVTLDRDGQQKIVQYGTLRNR